jgi:hypothetical protein
MKKFCLLLLMLFILSGCKSREEKVNELIKKEMYNTLYDYESYQPIENVIDSAFNVYNDSIMLKLAEAFPLVLKQKEEKESEIRWRNNPLSWKWVSIFGKRAVQDRFEEIGELYKGFVADSALCEKISRSIYSRADSLCNEVIGWEVKHKYRSRDKEGVFDIRTNVYVFDKKFKQILSARSLEISDSLKFTIDKCISEYRDIVYPDIKDL